MAKDKAQVSTTQDDLAKAKAAQMAKANSFKAESIGQFFKETWVELKKTTWPDANTLQKSTYIVLAFIFASALCVGTIDNLLTTATKNLLNH